MKYTRIHAVLMAAALVSAPAFADELADLKAALSKLQAKVEQMESQQKSAPAMPANVVTGGDLPGSFKLPGSDTSIKIGGYVQLDAAYDIKGDQGRGVSLADVPLDGTAAAKRKGTTTFSARTSRLNFETLTNTTGGPLKTRIEFDFYTADGSETYTNSAHPRLRHAYGTYGGFLAGQTWSNFMDVDSLPDTLEFFGPTGQIFIRQPQVRYTMATGANSSLAIAVENPQSDARDVGGDVTALDRGPDLTGRWTQTGAWGHVAVRGLLRDLRVEDGSGEHKANRLGWGLGLSGSFKLGAADTFLYQINGGQGIGRYIQDANSAAAYSATPATLRAQKAIGGFVGLQHYWATALRSNVVYGMVRDHNDEGYGSTAGLNKETRQVHANLVWSPVKQMDLGIEYIWGERKTEDGQTGDLSRLQASAKYSF